MLNFERIKIALRNNPAYFYFILLLSAWFTVNLIQSLFTGIAYDEAYYWMWAKQLDWGYFDHPPMVALFVKLSSLIFSDELSVRFTTILAQLASLFLLWKIIDEKEATKEKVILFFAIAASIPIFQVYGFITTPDSPLLFFTALFLYSYKRFLSSEKWINILLLSVSMAGLIYSTYHGGLNIF